MSSRSIGESITTLRKAAGLTQQQLAHRANISLSMLSKIEIGDRSASPAIVEAVTRALGVPPEHLEDHPIFPKQEVEPDIPLVQLRAALRSLDLARSGQNLDPGGQLRPAPALTQDMNYLMALRRSGRYQKVAAGLPPLLEELACQQAERTPPGNLPRLLIDGLYLAHSAAHRTGHLDLAGHFNQVLGQSAEDWGDPRARGLAQWTAVTSFQSGADYARGLGLIEAALAKFPANTDADALTIRGSLHLRAMVLASRLGDGHETTRHLHSAQKLAQGIRTDLHRWQLTFGPVNIAIHEVCAATDLADPDQAIAVSERLSIPAGLSATRAGHFYLNLARAYVAKGRRLDALSALEDARRVAPEHTRLHPTATETTRALISLQRRANSQLSRFSAWLGLIGT